MKKMIGIILIVMFCVAGCSNQQSNTTPDLKNYVNSLSENDKKELKTILEEGQTADKKEKDNTSENQEDKAIKSHHSEKETTNTKKESSEKYQCSICKKSYNKSEMQIIPDLCKSCYANMTCYLSDTEGSGLVKNSYECKVCGRYFSTSANRNLCTHGRCRGCDRFRDGDVTWIEGEGFYCYGCGSRMAEYYYKMDHKVCFECGSKKNLLEMKSGWVCQSCYDKNPGDYIIMSR